MNGYEIDFMDYPSPPYHYPDPYQPDYHQPPNPYYPPPCQQYSSYLPPEPYYPSHQYNQPPPQHHYYPPQPYQDSYSDPYFDPYPYSYSNPEAVIQPSPGVDPGSKSPNSEGKATTDEMLILLLKKMDKIDEGIKDINSRVKTMTFQAEQIASFLGESDLNGEEKESPSAVDEDVIPLSKEDVEECPLMDTSETEEESQEKIEEVFETEMSNPEVFTFSTSLDIIPIDYILPLYRIDEKLELKILLGVLETKGDEWVEMEARREKVDTCKLGGETKGGWYTHGLSLIDFEAKRLRYNGKEDRYPWPFR